MTLHLLVHGARRDARGSVPCDAWRVTADLLPDVLHSPPPGRRDEPLLDALRAGGPRRDAAVAELHALLLRGARHELARRRSSLAGLSQGELDDLAHQAADDAATAVLGKLGTFRGESRFTTWAYKFVLLEAGVRARRRTWRDREVPVADDGLDRLAPPVRSAHQAAEQSELLAAVVEAVRRDLTPHQREVFTALAVNQVPIDVLAERLATTRGALYKTLHDARRRLRASLAGRGFDIGDAGAGT
ncbi:MAG: sigma-70 family RNA polymerase sigma factor [Thermoleophilia bacterium]|nr:sigma-70 family RNA polymerase sigma factor [Thermoleophilia bacterium]